VHLGVAGSTSANLIYRPLEKVDIHLPVLVTIR